MNCEQHKPFRPTNNETLSTGLFPKTRSEEVANNSVRPMKSALRHAGPKRYSPINGRRILRGEEVLAWPPAEKRS